MKKLALLGLFGLFLSSYPFQAFSQDKLVKELEAKIQKLELAYYCPGKAGVKLVRKTESICFESTKDHPGLEITVQNICEYRNQVTIMIKGCHRKVNNTYVVDGLWHQYTMTLDQGKSMSFHWCNTEGEFDFYGEPPEEYTRELNQLRPRLEHAKKIQEAIADAKLSESSKDWTTALDKYRKIQKSDPGIPEVNQKIVEIKKIIAQQKASEEIRNNLDLADKDLQADNPEGAVEKYQEILKKDPTNEIVKEKLRKAKISVAKKSQNNISKEKSANSTPANGSKTGAEKKESSSNQYSVGNSNESTLRGDDPLMKSINEQTAKQDAEARKKQMETARTIENIRKNQEETDRNIQETKMAMNSFSSQVTVSMDASASYDRYQKRMKANITLVQSKDPDVLLRDYNRKIKEMKKAMEERKKEMEREVQRMVQARNSGTTNSMTQSANQLGGSIATMMNNSEIQKQKEANERKLNRMLEEAFDGIKEEIIKQNTSEGNQYLNNASVEVYETNELENYAMYKYHQCVIDETNREFSYSSTDWIKNNCIKPATPQPVSDYSGLKANDLFIAAKRKNGYTEFEMKRAAGELIDLALESEPENVEVLLFKASITSGVSQKSDIYNKILRVDSKNEKANEELLYLSLIQTRDYDKVLQFYNTYYNSSHFSEVLELKNYLDGLNEIEGYAKSGNFGSAKLKNELLTKNKFYRKEDITSLKNIENYEMNVAWHEVLAKDQKGFNWKERYNAYQNFVDKYPKIAEHDSIKSRLNFLDQKAYANVISLSTGFSLVGMVRTSYEDGNYSYRIGKASDPSYNMPNSSYGNYLLDKKYTLPGLRASLAYDRFLNSFFIGGKAINLYAGIYGAYDYFGKNNGTALNLNDYSYNSSLISQVEYMNRFGGDFYIREYSQKDRYSKETAIYDKNHISIFTFGIRATFRVHGIGLGTGLSYLNQKYTRTFYDKAWTAGAAPIFVEETGYLPMPEFNFSLSESLLRIGSLGVNYKKSTKTYAEGVSNIQLMDLSFMPNSRFIYRLIPIGGLNLGIRYSYFSFDPPFNRGYYEMKSMTYNKYTIQLVYYFRSF